MKKVILALLTCLPMAASAQDIIDERIYNDSTEYFMETAIIVDTAKIVAIANAHRAKLQLRADSLTALANTLNTIISDPKVKLTGNLLTAYSKAYTDIKTQYDTLMGRPHVDRYGFKDFDKVEKMMSKGKVNPNFIYALKQYVEYDCQLPARDCQSNIKADDFSLYHLMEFYQLPVAERKYPEKEIQVPKKNSNYRPAIFVENRDSHFHLQNKLDKLNSLIQKRGWEWLDKENSQEVEESYPAAYTYRKYASHPEYKVIHSQSGTAIYDLEGKLVRRNECLYDGYGSDDVRNIIEFLQLMEYRKDYEANKYDIQKENSDVQYALKNKLGYSNESANKQYESLGKAMENDFASNMATTRVERRLQAQKATANINNWLTEIFKANDPIANKFLKQLEKDHEEDYKYVYQIKRLDDVSFKIEFVTRDIKPKCDVYISYFTTEPYHCDYSIDRIVNH